MRNQRYLVETMCNDAKNLGENAPQQQLLNNNNNYNNRNENVIISYDGPATVVTVNGNNVYGDKLYNENDAKKFVTKTKIFDSTEDLKTEAMTVVINGKNSQNRNNSVRENGSNGDEQYNNLTTGIDNSTIQINSLKRATKVINSSNSLRRLPTGSSLRYYKESPAPTTRDRRASLYSCKSLDRKRVPVPVVSVAEKLSKLFCRNRTHTYHVQRRQKGLSLPPDFGTNQTTGNWVTVSNLRQLDGGILDPDDRLCDVVDDRDQIIAVYSEHPTEGINSSPPKQTPQGKQFGRHSRSHTPDIFGLDNSSGDAPLNYTDIEVTGEELSNTPPPLQVRRGSEPNLNRLSPIPTDRVSAHGGNAPNSHTVVGSSLRKSSVHSKRWSAAPVIEDDVTPPSSTPLKPNESSPTFLFEERGEGSGEEKVPSSSSTSSASSHHSATNGGAFSRFSRDNNRCSVQFLSDNPSLNRWADAAERIGGSGMSYNEMRRRDPVGGASTSPHHSRQPSLDARQRGHFKTIDSKQQFEGKYSVRHQEYQNVPSPEKACEGSKAEGSQHVRSKSLDAAFNNKEGNEERIMVVLNNGCGPLGIHVIPTTPMSRGVGGEGGLLVEGVEEGGRVAQDGRVKIHDRIIEINGHSLLNTTFHQAQEIFKDAMQAPALRLLVSKTGTSSTQPSEKKTELSLPKPAPTSLSARTQTMMLQSSSRRPGRPITLCLTKGRDGLGFSITTRDNPARGHAPIYIKSILPKGAAIEDGTLRIGDKLVSVNSKEVTGLSQAEVANLLRKVPVGGRAVLEVSRQERAVEATVSAKPTPEPLTDALKDRLKEDHPPSPQLPRPIGVERVTEDSLMLPWKYKEILTLEIPVHDSERAGLGVSVKGKTSNGSNDGPVDLGIFIKNVLCGGAASRDGRLMENDQLININGMSLLGTENSTAMETLRVAMHQEGPIPGVISLTIARRVPSAGSSTPTGRDSSGSNTTETLGGVRTSNNTPTPLDELKNPAMQRLQATTLRNNSYYQATHDTWNNSEMALTIPNTPVHKSSPTVSLPQGETVLIQDEYGTMGTKLDETYNSQCSLDNAGLFSRDQFGRQSMSEKRHATLDAKATDTYQRSKRNREERERSKERKAGEALPPPTPTSSTPVRLTPYHVSLPGYVRRMGGIPPHASSSLNRYGRRNASTSAVRRQAAVAPPAGHISSVAECRASVDGESSCVRLPGGSLFGLLRGVSRSLERPAKNSEKKTDIGPALGMKKSSSLESLQAMVHEVTVEEPPSQTQGPSTGGRHAVPRGRGCNESFRAAVDRSYDAPLLEGEGGMDTLAEEEVDTVAPPRLPLVDKTNTKAHPNAKKNKGLLKGLGSMFRFGKHRKTLDNNILPTEMLTHQSQETAKSQHRVVDSIGSFPQENHREDLQVMDEDPLGDPDSLGAPSRTERMHQLRAEHQRRHVERNKQYPSDGAVDGGVPIIANQVLDSNSSFSRNSETPDTKSTEAASTSLAASLADLPLSPILNEAKSASFRTSKNLSPNTAEPSTTSYNRAMRSISQALFSVPTSGFKGSTLNLTQSVTSGTPTPFMRKVVSASVFGCHSHAPNRHSFHGGMISKHAAVTNLDRLPLSPPLIDKLTAGAAIQEENSQLNRSMSLQIKKTHDESCSMLCRSCFRDEQDSSTRLTVDTATAKNETPSIYIINNILHSKDGDKPCEVEDGVKCNKTSTSELPLNVHNLQGVQSDCYLHNNVLYSRPVKKPLSNLCHEVSEGTKPLSPIVTMNSSGNMQRTSTTSSLSKGNQDVSKNSTLGIYERQNSVSQLTSVLSDVNVVHKPPLPPRNRSGISSTSVNSNTSTSFGSVYKQPPPPIHLRQKENEEASKGNTLSVYKAPPQPKREDVISQAALDRAQIYQPPPLPRRQSSEPECEPRNQVSSSYLIPPPPRRISNAPQSQVPLPPKRQHSIDMSNRMLPSYQVPPPPRHLRSQSGSCENTAERGRSMTVSDNANSKKKNNSRNSENKENLPMESDVKTFGAFNGNFPFTFSKSLSCVSTESTKDISDANKKREAVSSKVLSEIDNNQQNESMTNDVTASSDHYENVSGFSPHATEQQTQYQPVMSNVFTPNGPHYASRQAMLAPQPLSSGSSSGSSSRSSSLPRMGVMAATQCPRYPSNYGTSPSWVPSDSAPPVQLRRSSYHTPQMKGAPSPAPPIPPKVFPSNPLGALVSTNILTDSRFWRMSPVPPPPHTSSTPIDTFNLGGRPGSRGVGNKGGMMTPAAAASAIYGHYANYQQIQQHLRSSEQDRLQKLASQQYRNFREKQHNRRPRPHTSYFGESSSDQEGNLLRKLEQCFIDDAINKSRECREYQSQRGPRDNGSHAPTRPASNYFEYESVQAIMSRGGGGGKQRQPQPPAERQPQPPAEYPYNDSAQSEMHGNNNTLRGSFFTSSYSSNHSNTRHSSNNRNSVNNRNTSNSPYAQSNFSNDIYHTRQHSNSSQNSLPRNRNTLHQYSDNLPMVAEQPVYHGGNQHHGYQPPHSGQTPLPGYHAAGGSSSSSSSHYSRGATAYYNPNHYAPTHRQKGTSSYKVPGSKV